MQPLQTNTIETFAEGITRVWHAEQHIVIYTVPDVKRSHVDSWTETVLADLGNWPQHRPYLVLHDISSGKTALTPYVRRSALKMARACAPHKGRLAALMTDSLLQQIISVFLKSELKRQMPDIQVKTFTDRAAAIAWLEEGL